MFDNYEESFTQSDLQYNKFWLQNSQYIVNQNKQYSDNLYKECNELIDLFCLQLLREISYTFSEESEFDIRDRIWDFISIIDSNGIDFNLVVLLAGEDYIKSDYYLFENDDCEERQLNVLFYLLNINYDKIINILISHYGNEQKLLLNTIEDFNIYDRYQEAIVEIQSLEDMFDYPEIVKIHEWAEGGFSISGEQ